MSTVETIEISLLQSSVGVMIYIQKRGKERFHGAHEKYVTELNPHAFSPISEHVELFILCIRFCVVFFLFRNAKMELGIGVELGGGGN